MEEQKLNLTLVNAAAFIIILGAAITFMIIAADFLIPLAWAFLFSYLMHPICLRLEKRGWKRSLAALTATLIFITVTVAILYFLIMEAYLVVKEELVTGHKWSLILQEVSGWLKEKLNVDLQPILTDSSEGANSVKDAIGILAQELSAVGSNIAILTLIPMYLFFILNYRGLIHRFMDLHFNGEKQAAMHRFLNDTRVSIFSYLYGTFILTGVTVVMSFAILLLFGINYAFFFAVFIAVLNLIPYIGNLLAFVVVLSYAWMSKGDAGTALLIGGCLYLSNMIQENFLRPVLIGSKMEMNALVVFLAVIAGGTIWGVSGMVLFIPLLGVLKAVLDNRKNLKDFSVFFEEG